MGAPPVVVTSQAWAHRQRALARPADTRASVPEPRRTACCALHASAGFIRPAPSHTDPPRQSGSRTAQPARWRRTCTPEAARTAGSPMRARRSAPQPHAPKTRSRRKATKSGLPFPPRRGRKGAGGIGGEARCNSPHHPLHHRSHHAGSRRASGQRCQPHATSHRKSPPSPLRHQRTMPRIRRRPRPQRQGRRLGKAVMG